MKEMQAVRMKKIVFFAVVSVSFLAILIYNFFTPLMSDDLLFDASQYHTFTDIIKEVYHQYMNWTGRVVIQFIWKLCSLMPEEIFNILNSACFVLLMLLVYWNVVGNNKYDSILYIIINLLAWNFSVEFDQTVLWMGGACNYLWATVIILGLITFYRYLLDGKISDKHRIALCIGLFVWGVLAGCCFENTSGGGILIILFLTFLYYLRHKKILSYMISVIVGLVTGFLFLICAPGNKVRGSYMLADERHTGLMAYVSRFLKINKNVNQHMMLYIAVIIVLLVYFLHKKKKIGEFMYIFMFSIAALATSYALIFTPEPMPRAYFGANIFMMIACVGMINKITKEDEILYSLKNGLAIAACVWMYFSYMENGANLARIQRSVNERESYILEQTAQGNFDLTLPMVSTDFETSYSYIFESDITQDSDYYINQVFLIKYHLNSIEAVEAEDWMQ